MSRAFVGSPEAQALYEIRQEEFRAKVEACKDIIRERRARPWWRRLFPFRITVTRI